MRERIQGRTYLCIRSPPFRGNVSRKGLCNTRREEAREDEEVRKLHAFLTHIERFVELYIPLKWEQTHSMGSGIFEVEGAEGRCSERSDCLFSGTWGGVHQVAASRECNI